MDRNATTVSCGDPLPNWLFYHLVIGENRNRSDLAPLLMEESQTKNQFTEFIDKSFNSFCLQHFSLPLYTVSPFTYRSNKIEIRKKETPTTHPSSYVGFFFNYISFPHTIAENCQTMVTRKNMNDFRYQLGEVGGNQFHSILYQCTNTDSLPAMKMNKKIEIRFFHWKISELKITNKKLTYYECSMWHTDWHNWRMGMNVIYDGQCYTYVLFCTFLPYKRKFEGEFNSIYTNESYRERMFLNE